MPEGDTVWLHARRLHDALADRVLERTDFRVPAHATVDLTGRTVLDARSRGKHLLIRVDGGVTVASHLGMEGTWRILAADAAPRGGPAWQLRAVLATAERQALGYRLRRIDVLPTSAEARLLGHLGPDLAGEDWDPAEAVRRLGGQPDRAIGEALLDQRNLAGLGTVYRAEVLYVAGVSPWTPVAAVPDLADVVAQARRLLTANLGRFEQVTTGDPRPGHQHFVYGRAGRSCRRCGTAVRRAQQGAAPRDRVVYWCPRCQPERG